MTQRDMEVVRLLMAGHNANQIARILNEKRYTTQTRIDRIARKLKINGRALIAAYVIIHEIISLEEARALLTERVDDPEPY